MIANIKIRLRSLEVYSVYRLKTTLFCSNEPIPASEADVPYFVEKVLVSGEETSRVYVDSLKGTSEDGMTSLLVANAVEEICEGLLGRRALLIPHMLRCPLGAIWSHLDSLGVRPDDSFSAEQLEIPPEPGSFIPQEDHHRLNDDFEEFAPDDDVGYELHDPSLVGEGGDATYIYATIIEEVTSECNSRLIRRYRINIGNDQEEVVDATDLYKFHRLTESSSTAMVLCDRTGQPPTPRSRQGVFDKISDLLEEAWTLPEKKRRKITKRLYLRWHPDKNLGDEEFCKEVCQYIQSEVSRLKRGEPKGGSYGSFFVLWALLAREHYRQRWEHRGRPPCHRKNPQPREARRWFKQAVADIQAASNDIIYERPSYEWACFKCHQVIVNISYYKVI